MGKVVGHRWQRRKSSQQRQLSENATCDITEMVHPRLETETSTPSTRQDLELWSQFSTDGEFALSDFSNDIGSLEFQDTTSTICIQDAPLTTGELFDLDFLPSPSSQLDPDLHLRSQSLSSASSGISPTETSLINSPTNHNQSVADWITHIDDLNKKLCQSSLALDDLLSTNSFHLQRIHSELDKIPSDGSRISIILAIVICLTQVLTLFEQSMNPNTMKTLFGGTTSLSPALLLGSFRVDLESQRQILVQIVCKELTGVFGVAKDLKAAIMQSSGASGGQSRIYITLVEDVQKRVQLLVNILKQS